MQETFLRFRAGKLNEREVRSFLEGLQLDKDTEKIKLLILESLEEDVDEKILNTPELVTLLDDSLDNIMKKMAPVRPFNSWYKIASVAAVLFVMLSVGLFLISRNTADVNRADKITPGKQTATLTLSNGRQIRLQDSKLGQLAEESGVSISKSADGQLVYEVEDQAVKNSGMNILSTAKGESYKVRLPDGTQVWLNAASSISYQTNFSTQKLRNVTLKGEAYFEVTKDLKRPFIVKTDQQEVMVLGTRFNINSYTDELGIRTTLVEGKVKINTTQKEIVIHPGQQAMVSHTGNIKLTEVDTDKMIAWTKNEFIFDGEDIESVMRKISRWYNVDIVYKGDKTKERFGGGLSRFDKVEQVLELLEKTKAVHFTIKGKTIYVK